MESIDVQLNDEPFQRMAIVDAVMLDFRVTARAFGDEPADLWLTGMVDLPNERQAHVYWAEAQRLAVGDSIRVCFEESMSASAPNEIVATDDPKYLQEQKEFEELDSKLEVIPVLRPRARPNLGLEVAVNGESATRFSLGEAEEHIAISLVWNKWKPGRCRLTVSTSGPTKPGERKNRCNRLTEFLALASLVEVKIVA